MSSAKPIRLTGRARGQLGPRGAAAEGVFSAIRIALAAGGTRAAGVPEGFSLQR